MRVRESANADSRTRKDPESSCFAAVARLTFDD
jgi:hypothetical protein